MEEFAVASVVCVLEIGVETSQDQSGGDLFVRWNPDTGKQDSEIVVLIIHAGE